MLNDKYDPAWQVLVDGTPAPLLRCNYLMRGVYLPSPGEHTVEFKFSQPLLPVGITLISTIAGVLLLVSVGCPRRGPAGPPAGDDRKKRPPGS